MHCRRTADGYAYPVDVPWGNTGTSAAAVCMAGIYHKVRTCLLSDFLCSACISAADQTVTHSRRATLNQWTHAARMQTSGEAFDDPQMMSARCFIQKQLGHLVNHKCVSSRDPAEFGCNTDSVEGYSYMMGCAAAFMSTAVNISEYIGYCGGDIDTCMHVGLESMPRATPIAVTQPTPSGTRTRTNPPTRTSCVAVCTLHILSPHMLASPCLFVVDVLVTGTTVCVAGCITCHLCVAELP